MKGDTEWAALQQALKAVSPACDGDDRYLRDRADLTETELIDMRNKCAACPLLTECQTYASAAKPTGGYWPKPLRTRTTRRTT